jgi:hypothetical protein
VPRRLGVLGGGVVGCELAQAFRRLGSEVVLLQRGPRLLPGAEPFAGERVAAALRADGVDVRLDTGLDSVAADGDAVVLHVGGGTVVVDELLVATGRRPRTDDVGVDVVGLTPGDPLTVDDSGLVQGVAGEWLYAAGDVTGRAPLTHQGKYAARIVGAVIGARAQGRPADTGPWGEHSATADHGAVPQVVFTDPEVASVGRTRRRPATPGWTSAWSTCPSPSGGRPLQADGYDGAARLVVENGRDVLVGATFVGQDVAEMLHAGHDRAGRGGAAGPAVARGPGLPHDQRGVAAAAGGRPAPMSPAASRRPPRRRSRPHPAGGVMSFQAYPDTIGAEDREGPRRPRRRGARARPTAPRRSRPRSSRGSRTSTTSGADTPWRSSTWCATAPRSARSTSAPPGCNRDGSTELRLDGIANR